MAKKKRQAEFVKWFGPLLDALRELGYSGKPKEVTNKIAEMQAIDDATLESTIKSGINRFENQVAWARQYLTWEGLLDSTTRDLDAYRQGQKYAPRLRSSTCRIFEMGRNTSEQPRKQVE